MLTVTFVGAIKITQMNADKCGYAD